MKSYILAIGFFVLSLFSFAQNSFLWAKQLGSPVNDVALATTTDVFGNVYTTGYFFNTIDLDPGPGVYTLTSNGTCDAYISKLDSLGNFLWAKRIGGINDDTGGSLTTDAAGNIYILGDFQYTADFDPGPGTYTITSMGSLDIFILKLDPNGNFVWAKSLSGINIGQEYCIRLDSFGNIYATGYFTGTMDLDPGIATYTLQSQGMQDVFILKLDPAGNFIWANTFGSTGPDEGNAFDFDNSGNIYLTGYFRLTVDFDPGPSVFNLTSVGNSDVFVLKLNSSGNFIWAKSIGSAGDDYGYGLDINQAGDLCIGGSYNGTADFDPGPGIYNLTASASNYRGFVLKWDLLGNFIWAKTLGGPGGSGVRQLITDAANNIYTTGSFDSNGDFDPGPSSYILSSLGYTDVFISKLDVNGNFIFAKRMGGIDYDFSSDITCDFLGNVFSVGFFKSSVNFNTSGGSTYLNSFGGSDAYIHKIGTCFQPPPPLNISNSSNLNSCIPNSTTLTVSGSGTVHWYASPSSTIVLGTGSSYITSSLSVGNYTLYADDSTCVSSINKTPVSFTVHSLPIILASSNSSVLCANQTAILSAIGATSYTWSNGYNTPSISISPTVSTTYFVTGSNIWGCENNDTIIQVVQTCAGINNSYSKNYFGLKIYPNPVNLTLNLKKEIETDITITITNALGQVFINEIISNTQNSIDMHNLPNGIYFFTAKEEDYCETFKLIKE